MTDLTPQNIYSQMLSLFPSQNDLGESESLYKEIHEELIDFRIFTMEDFKNMMVRHRTRILNIDSGREKHQGYMLSPLYHLLRDDEQLKLYKEKLAVNLARQDGVGDFYRKHYQNFDVDDRIKHRYWSSFIGLIRIGMELEFGVEYMTYCETRWEGQ